MTAVWIVCALPIGIVIGFALGWHEAARTYRSTADRWKETSELWRKNSDGWRSLAIALDEARRKDRGR